MSRSKKGYAILDSAIVMPIIILTLIFLIYLNSILFGFVLEKSQINRSARILAGEKAGTSYIINNEKSNKQIEYSELNDGIIYRKIVAKNNTTYNNIIFYTSSFNKLEESEATIFNETNFIRNSEFLINNVFSYLKEDNYGNN
jgi:hypothetical protein